MSTLNEYEQKIIKHVDKDIVTDVDGFRYWWPEGSNGHLPAKALRAIADELDRRNAAWEADIAAYFEKQENQA